MSDLASTTDKQSRQYECVGGVIYGPGGPFRNMNEAAEHMHAMKSSYDRLLNANNDAIATIERVAKNDDEPDYEPQSVNAPSQKGKSIGGR